MSSIMGMVRGYEFGEVREMKAVGEVPPFRGGVRIVSERLFGMAAQLEKGQYLGFELVFGKEMTGSLRVFSTAWAETDVSTVSELSRSAGIVERLNLLALLQLSWVNYHKHQQPGAMRKQLYLGQNVAYLHCVALGTLWQLYVVKRV